MTHGLGEFTLTNSLTISIFLGHEEFFISSCHEKMEMVNEFEKVNSQSPRVIA